MSEEVNKAEIADALAAELGVEDIGANTESAAATDFYEAVKQMASSEEPEPAAEAPAPEETPPAFVHQPTGKEFESELDLLRYESGYKDNKYGNELKEVKAKLEAYEALVKGAGDEPPKQQLTPEQQQDMLMRRALEGTGVDLEQVDPSAYKTIFKMVENMLGMYDTSVVNQRFQELQGTVEKITTRAQEAEALHGAGITSEQVTQALQKYPSLKALPPSERVAVIADLVNVQEAKQAAPETGNALRQTMQREHASNHVEGSVGSVPPDNYESSMSEAFFNLPDSDKLAALGKMFEDSEVGARIKDAHI